MAESRRKKLTKRSVARDIKRIPDANEAMAVLDELKEEVGQRVIEQPTERVPGLTVGGTKTTWTYKDCEDKFPYVKFMAEETVPLTFQGVTVQAFAGFEMHVPECFKKIYDNHRKEARLASKDSYKEAGLRDLGPMVAGALSDDFAPVK